MIAALRTWTAAWWRMGGPTAIRRANVIVAFMVLARFWGRLFAVDWPGPTAAIVVALASPLTLILEREIRANGF